MHTDRDALRRVVHPRVDPETTPISMVMTRDVRFVAPGASVEAALALMLVNRFRHLLVMEGPRLLGLISIADLTSHLIRHGAGRFEAPARVEAAQDVAALSGGAFDVTVAPPVRAWGFGADPRGGHAARGLGGEPLACIACPRRGAR